jgi:hypothetical protein
MVLSLTSWTKFVTSIESTSKMVICTKLYTLIDVDTFNVYSFEQ